MQEIIRKDNKNNNHNLLYIITAVLAVVLIVLIVFAVTDESRKAVPKDKNAEESSNEIYSEEEELQLPSNDNVFEKDTYPEVNVLVKEYFSACAANDFATLEQIVSSLSDEEMKIILRRTEYVEAYNDVVTYTKLGPIENSYLVFATYNMKFINIDTAVPGMETIYVKTDENGKMYIYKGEVEAEVGAYIATALQSEDAVEIIENVNKAYLDVLVSHEDVLKLMEKFEISPKLVEEAKRLDAEAKAQAEQAKKEAEAKAASEAAAQAQAAADAQTSAAQNAQAVNEQVVVVQTVNVRESNSETAAKVGSAFVGETVTRTGITQDGWSKIKYSGGEGYAKSEFLSKFSLKEDKVKPTTVVNVRSECSETANIIGQLDVDSKYERNASYENGWSQIVFEGSAAYVKSEYLTN